MEEFENETAGHRPANAARQPAQLARAAILRSRPSSPSPCGSRPCGSRSGAGQYSRPPIGDRRHSLRPRHAVRVSRRRCARIPFHALLRRLSGSRRRIRRHAGTRPSGAQAENRPCGPTVSTASGGASVFQLAPRYPPSASWGLRRRLRRGWKGGAGHRFPRP